MPPPPMVSAAKPLESKLSTCWRDHSAGLDQWGVSQKGNRIRNLMGEKSCCGPPRAAFHSSREAVTSSVRQLSRPGRHLVAVREPSQPTTTAVLRPWSAGPGGCSCWLAEDWPRRHDESGGPAAR